jgi:hypothetical protein
LIDNTQKGSPWLFISEKYETWIRMSASGDKLRQHLIPILILILYGLLCNLVGLRDFDPQLAWWGDDNLAYYAERAVAQPFFPGDLWHNSMQAEFVTLSAAYWIPAFLYKLIGIPPVTSALVFTALKVWMLTGAGYLLAYLLVKKPLTAAVTAIGINSSYIMFWNLAGYGYWHYMPYGSDLAYPLVLISLFFLCKRKVLFAILTLMVTVNIHPSIGAFGSFFLVFSLVFDFSQFSKKQKILILSSLVPLALIAILPSRFVLAKLSPDSLSSAQAVYNALNVTHGGYWETPFVGWWTKIYGFLLFSLYLIPAYIANLFKTTRIRKLLQLTQLASMVLLCLGIAIKFLCIAFFNSDSLKYLIPFHQLLLPRASVFFLIITFIVVAVYLISRLRSHESVSVRLAALISLTLFVSLTIIEWNHPSYSFVFVHIALVLILVTNEIRSKRRQKGRGQFPIGFPLQSIVFELIMVMLLLVVFIISYNHLLFGMTVVFQHIVLGLLVFSTFLSLFTPIHKRIPIKIRPANYAISLISAVSLSIFSVHSLSRGMNFLQAPASFGLIALFPFLPLMAVLDTQPEQSSSRLRLVLKGAPITVILLFAVAASVQGALSMRLPENHITRDWFAASIWTREHTPEQTSFLLLMDDPPLEWRRESFITTSSPGGWRTYSQRGKISLFEPVWGTVYYPNPDAEEYDGGISDYWQNKHPGMNRGEILKTLDEEDLLWLQNYTGASYAIAPSSLQISRPILYRNEHVVIYSLDAPDLACQNMCQQMAAWLEKNSEKSQTLISSEPVCDNFISQVQVLDEGFNNLDSLLESMPDFLITSEDNMNIVVPGDFQLENDGVPEEFLNYQEVYLSNQDADCNGQQVNIYERVGLGSLHGLAAEVTGSPLLPSPNGIDVLLYDGDTIPDDMYLSAYEGAALPYTLEIELIQPTLIEGIGMVWWSESDHPIEGQMTGWLGQEKVFEADLPIEDVGRLPYSWIQLEGDPAVDQLRLSVSAFEGQQRLILRRFFIQTNLYNN